MFIRQVFWLPRLFGGLPIPLKRSSGSRDRTGFLRFMKQGYSGGTAPDFDGIPY
jgi:hypothetical protein